MLKLTRQSKRQSCLSHCALESRSQLIQTILRSKQLYVCEHGIFNATQKADKNSFFLAKIDPNYYFFVSVDSTSLLKIES